jgi:hypothetical protein
MGELPFCSGHWAAATWCNEMLKAMGLNTGWSILLFLMVLEFIMGFFFDWCCRCSQWRCASLPRDRALVAAQARLYGLKGWPEGAGRSGAAQTRGTS